MRLGVGLPMAGEWATPRNQLRVARAAEDLGRVAPVARELREEAVKIGRDPATLHVVSRGSYHVFDRPQGKERRPLWGSFDEIREDIARYAEAGLTELFLEPNFQPVAPTIDRVLAHMDALAPR